ncbi:recombinase family protein [Halobacillus trueperi]|uniref:recombinase family protein n=1 Tax=Halobacillus trueperi TaxID=156205 RepID=UPI003736059F
MGQNVAIYIRVSTVEQAEKGFSIEAQEHQLKEYCRKNGLRVYKVYSDSGISGKGIKGRSELQSLLLDAKNGCFNGVLVWKINRLARNLKDLLDIQEQFNSCNISLKSITEAIDTSTPHGKLGLQMVGAIGQLEREVILENTKLGRDRRNQLGIYCGAAIYGYDVIPRAICKRDKLNTNLNVNPREAKVVKDIFAWYSQGDGLKVIVNRLNKNGIKSKKGKLFSVNVVRQMLENVVYIGRIRYTSQEGVNVVEGSHPRIIDIELWEKVQIRLAGRKRETKTSREFLFSSVLKCPSCGNGMTGTTIKNKRKNGTIKGYSYYVCSTHINKGIKGCKTNSIPAEKIECKILNSLEDFISQDGLVHDLYAHLNKIPSSTGFMDLSGDHIEKMSKKLTSFKEELMTKFEQGLISDDEFIGKLEANEIEKQKVDVQRERSALKSERSYIAQEEIKSILSNFSLILQTADPQVQKELLNALVREVKVGNDKEILKVNVNIKNEIIAI